ncbi:MAG: patatin-like phospholipase family protein [Pseudomonadota bacterium]|nr:patatin-like phospholipase family protein [Pseudomonadota bacterium]
MLDLQEIPFFSQFSFDELEVVRRAVELQDYAPGTFLCCKGETGRTLFAIASGGVKVLTTDAHGFYHGPGHLIGELSLLSGLPVSATVVATKPTRVYTLGKETLQSLLDSKPSLYRTFTEMLASRVRRHPVDRSLEAPTCVIVGCVGGVGECYAFARALFGRIAKYAHDSIFCQSRDPEDSATSAVRPGEDTGVPRFLRPLGERYQIVDDDLGGHFGKLLQEDPSQPTELIRAWRSFGAYGQCLVLSLPWHEVKSLTPDLESQDAVICLVPPGVGAEIDLAPNECTTSLGKADCAMVRLVRGGDVGGAPGRRRRCFVINVDGWRPETERPMDSKSVEQLERLARWSAGCSTGLSLGSGAARGVAHLGVIKVLEDAGIPIDCLSGTSIGGIVASAYSLAGSADATIDLAREWLGKKSKVLDTFNSLGASLVPGKKIRKVAEAVFGSAQFEDLPIPVSMVATDLVTGEKVVMDEGSLVEAALGSSAIPGFFPPIRWGDRYLIDGANVSRVPVDQLDKYRCGVKIAVNVAPLPGSEAMDEAAIKKHFFSMLGFRNIWLRSWELQAYWHGTREASHADIILEPDTRRFGMLDFDRFDELLDIGIRTTTEKLAEIEEIVALKSRPGEVQP